MKIFDITLTLVSFLLGGVIALFLFDMDGKIFIAIGLGAVGYYIAIVIPVLIRTALEGKDWS